MRARHLALILFCCFAPACSEEEAPPAAEIHQAEKPLTPTQLAQSREASRDSYEKFLEASNQAIESELGKCRSAILDELKRQHLNAMLSDKPSRTIFDMKREARQELKRLAVNPRSPGLDFVMESVSFCTFDRSLSERVVHQGSAFCQFKNGKYAQHGIGALSRVPKGLVYTCDGYGL